MTAGDWHCLACNGLIGSDSLSPDDYKCVTCGREYVERDGGLVPLVQPGEPDQGGRHMPRGKRHVAGWRER